MDYALVMSGGAMGAAARLAISRSIGAPPPDGWPLATLVINLVGGLLMGLLVGWLMRRGGGEHWRLLIGVGILGGFTTFSTFSLELVDMISAGRWTDATGYAVISTLGAIVLLSGGLWLARLA